MKGQTMAWWTIYDGSMMFVTQEQARRIGRLMALHKLSVRLAFEEVVPPEKWDIRWKDAG